MTKPKFNTRALEEIRKYAQGLQSCSETAYNLRTEGLTADFEPNPRAADVIVWSKALGFGIPDVSAEEAMRKAEEVIARFTIH